MDREISFCVLSKAERRPIMQDFFVKKSVNKGNCVRGHLYVADYQQVSRLCSHQQAPVHTRKKVTDTYSLESHLFSLRWIGNPFYILITSDFANLE
jgi:hypothetical protein